ncbi:Putative F0F1-ATPase subunit Ca2+/Mg2+ transporter [Desulfacinum hydrothermale DSM 13146]|uniref:Putative F0F1-ATPase subunit Ca2+/Mg2+ transporter n=2 Tax=Desulfacinum hydrothermale TaxID=109258 RepID=A0A1W1WYN8_9BACT|nr:Putative F0F1-ATPase subunit Ca2+/Mg2+ transporter [Desulfacinum hydrothermale DSM 13146]
MCHDVKEARKGFSFRLRMGERRREYVPVFTKFRALPGELPSVERRFIENPKGWTGSVQQQKNCFTIYGACARKDAPYGWRDGTFMKDFKKNRDLVEYLALVSQLGLTMAGSILFCFVIGYFLDKWLHTRGVFLVVFIVLGVVGGAVTVYRQITQLPKK